MNIWKVQVTAEELNDNKNDDMVKFLGIEFTEVGDDFISGKMVLHNQRFEQKNLIDRSKI